MFEAIIIHMGLRGHEQVGSEGRKAVKVFNEKGFWEGGVIPNTCSDIRSPASFQLWLIADPKTLNPKP